jgi:hypothetical protein
MAAPEVKVKVGADTADLHNALGGVDKALARLKTSTDRMGKSLDRFGDQAVSLGKKMSVLSAGVVAAGTGALLLARGTAQSAREIQNFSRTANAGTTEFQRMAAGAETVGIEQSKLADILKDVNDRIGDFNATGGGPMADFFENIAPKVGVTADQFARLSGPEALQLYADSLQRAGLNQQQMTFYMEAMASDATALLPLLKDSGAGMNALGDAAQRSGRIMDQSAIAKSNEFNIALQNLQGAFQGVKDRFAVTLMPMMTDLMNRITSDVIPAINSVVSVIGGWVEAFNDLPDGVQAAAGAIAAAFAVGGPVLIGIGLVSKALGGLLLFMGPVGLIAAAVAGGIAVWATYGDAASAQLQRVVDKANDLADKMLEVIGLGDRAENIRMGAAQGSGVLPGSTTSIGGIVSGLAGGIRGALFPGKDAGASLADGVVNGYNERMMERVPELDATSRIPEQVFREATETKSPSQVFHRLGTYLGDGMAQGINESSELVAQAARNMGWIAVSEADNSVSGVLSAMGNLFQGSKKISAGIALANSWLAFTEVLKDPSFIGRPFARLAAAGAALSAGLNAVRNIKSASASGSGGGASSGGGGSAAQPAPMPTQTFVIDAPGINLESFVNTANEAIKRGYRIDFRTA